MQFEDIVKLAKLTNYNTTSEWNTCRNDIKCMFENDGRLIAFSLKPKRR